MNPAPGNPAGEFPFGRRRAGRGRRHGLVRDLGDADPGTQIRPHPGGARMDVLEVIDSGPDAHAGFAAVDARDAGRAVP